MARHAPALTLSPRVRAVLEALHRQRKLEHRFAERVQIALWSADGMRNLDQARKLGVDPQRIARWRNRLAAAAGRLEAAAGAAPSEEELTEAVLSVLADNYRSGVPAKFSAQQLTAIVALACKEPRDLGLPVTHWTPREIAIEAAKQGIVESISVRHVARFFRGGGAQAAPLAVLAESQNRRSRTARGGGERDLRAVQAGPRAPRSRNTRHLG